MDAIKIYGHSMSQPVPFDEIKFGRNVCLVIFKTPDDSDIGYFVEVDLTYPDNIKNKKIPFCPCW